MDPITLSVVGGLVGAGVGALSNWLAGSADAKEREMRMEAVRQYAALSPPQARELIAREVARTATADVNRNQGLEATQDEVLNRYLEVARNGESAQGRADYEQAALDSAQLERASRQAAVSQGMAAGLGADAVYTDQLLASQAGADRERMAGLQRAAANEQARMSALGNAGSLASSRSNTQFQQDFSKAQAQDELNMFNAGQWNDMLQYNDQARYQAFNAQLAKANGMANAYNGVASSYGQQADRTREMGANIGAGVGRAIQAPATYGAWQSQQPGYQPPTSPTTGAQMVGAAPLQQSAANAQAQQQQLQTGLPPTTTATRRKAR